MAFGFLLVLVGVVWCLLLPNPTRKRGLLLITAMLALLTLGILVKSCNPLP
jgi:hypothetical protein